MIEKESAFTNKPWMDKLMNNPICEQEKNEFVAMLNFLNHPEGNEKSIEHLKKQNQENQQTHSYNELAIGYLLKINGHSLEYEKRIERPEDNGYKTPDWYISKSDKSPDNFIVEVFTTSSRSDKETEKADIQIKLLQERLEKIKFDALIEVCIDKSGLNESRNIKIAKELSSIFTNRSFIMEEYLYENTDLNFKFKIKRRNVGYGHLKALICPWIFPVSTYGNIDRFEKKISEKVSKYKRFSIPLVIVPFVDRGISEKIMKMPLMIDYLKENPAISAIVWMDRIHPSVCGWHINIIYNLKATFKLSNIFTNEEHVYSNNDVIRYHVPARKNLQPSPFYEMIQKKLREHKLHNKLKNNSEIEMYCDWDTPISCRFEYLSLLNSDREIEQR
jgi:hypothetical protein